MANIFLTLSVVFCAIVNNIPNNSRNKVFDAVTGWEVVVVVISDDWCIMLVTDIFTLLCK